LKLAFLGTGSAFSVERYNGAVVVDDHLLLDAGAPLLPHMNRLGIDPGRIDALFLTHFHGDHILGLPPYVLYRAFVDHSLPCVIVGQEGVEEHLEGLFDLCWGAEWHAFRTQARLEYDEARGDGEAGGVRYETVLLRHGPTPTRGYRLHLDGRVLAYAGDTEATAELDQLVEGADIAITEATGPSESAVHTSWEQARAVAARHPKTRFLFNHVFTGKTENAVEDLDVVET
jgi:ribonuclease BN (tRNA processing enzyme)